MYKLIIKFKRKELKIRENILKSEVLSCLNLQDEVFHLKEIKLEKNSLSLKIDGKEFLNKLINEITKLKLENRKLKILDFNLDIQEVKLEKCKRLLENKILTIEFLTPTLFKIGSNFKGEYSNYLFFSWLLRKFNKLLPKENKINISRESIEKISVIENSLESVEVQLKDYTTTAFKGKLKLNFENIDSELIENFENILNYGIENGVGYKNKNGYGKIKINS
ncbi:MAG: CRISPR system precrRNA processing endoribonuclease RAMP protein Cas6 [Fusobacterium sp.]|uniref:CRISPR system precrRNA processing endoribonuclease RAMP protein Cas6 n=1 Tax=Fusobacterium sp. TaxID=68766 RepID=UPI0029433435|nr:CRISPR system precrRNA processing endoribonuclease RAMP protein Cas6 [Fusobacterium sp.]MDY3059162.1 CRISPR system precrRNA processing endoribonuclease RAMP protein Cas6 [Fusobacterium sp.]